MVDPTLLGIAESHWNPRPSDKKAQGIYQIKAALDQWNQDHPQEQYTVDDMANKPSLGKKVANYYINAYIPAYMKKFNMKDTPKQRVGMYNAGPWGIRQREQKVGKLANAPLESETTRLMNLYESLSSFDPEGSGYWQVLAEEMGMGPDKTGHWQSREPNTGIILKGMKHPTIQKSYQADRDLGYAWMKSLSPQGYYQSVPVAPPDYYLKNR
jgi:hypothetical protein